MQKYIIRLTMGTPKNKNKIQCSVKELIRFNRKIGKTLWKRWCLKLVWREMNYLLHASLGMNSKHNIEQKDKQKIPKSIFNIVSINFKILKISNMLLRIHTRVELKKN